MDLTPVSPIDDKILENILIMTANPAIKEDFNIPISDGDV